MRVTFSSKGDFKKLTSFLEKSKEVFNVGILDKYGKAGVDALASSTPVDTGLLKDSWYYKIENHNGTAKLIFYNSDIENGCPIAIIIQYGHATRNGGWVEGRDYINPALKPIFDKLADEAWREVTNR